MSGDLPVLVAQSPLMKDLLEVARTAAGSHATILLTGETGSGKGAVAQEIHATSPRSHGPLVHVNCAALPADLLECELFGVEQGAFTDASERAGRFEQAANGTIFLDEIGELSQTLQAKLLRILDTKSYERVGGTFTHTTNARVIAATNRDLNVLRRQGGFRDDLFFRLNVFWLYVPPLRDRKEDIVPLARLYIEKHARETGKSITDFMPEAVARLEQYYWPGNVRELENCIQRAVLMSNGPMICDEHLLLPDVDSHLLIGISTDSRLGLPTPPQRDRVKTLHEAERDAILRALQSAQGNRTRAATLLGISVRGLYNKMQRHGIKDGQ